MTPLLAETTNWDRALVLATIATAVVTFVAVVTALLVATKELRLTRTALESSQSATVAMEWRPQRHGNHMQYLLHVSNFGPAVARDIRIGDTREGEFATVDVLPPGHTVAIGPERRPSAERPIPTDVDLVWTDGNGTHDDQRRIHNAAKPVGA